MIETALASIEEELNKSKVIADSNSDDASIYCNCPIQQFCELTTKDIHLMETTRHCCKDCGNKVFGPCLGEQLDSPMESFWCRTCEDADLSKNGKNVLQNVKDAYLKIVKLQARSNESMNLMDVVDDSKNSKDDPKNCQISTDPKNSKDEINNWAECLGCRQTLFSDCLNKAKICPECVNKEIELKKKTLMEESDSSDDDKSQKKK